MKSVKAEEREGGAHCFHWSGLNTEQLTLIIIMYIYHAFINALSAHLIHINLNTIFYTYVEHLPKQFT